MPSSGLICTDGLRELEVLLLTGVIGAREESVECDIEFRLDVDDDLREAKEFLRD